PVAPAAFPCTALFRSYLHSTIATRRQRVRVPAIPMHLDGLLADRPLTCGLQPMLGAVHLRVLTIIGFPSATTPGILDDLNRLARSEEHTSELQSRETI